MNNQEIKQTRSAKIWYVAEPIAEYWVITNVMVLLITVLTGGNKEDTTLAGAIAIAVGGIFFLYRYKGENAEKKVVFKMGAVWNLLFFILAAMTASVWMNILAVKTAFAQMSQVYQQTSAQQYSVSLLGGIILYGMISPLAEELVFRGMVQSRVRSLTGRKVAIVLSAFFFGLYHGNIVQGVYAFCMGLFFAYGYERYQTIAVPILLHCMVNILSFTTSYTGIMTEKIATTGNLYFFMAVSFLLLLVIVRNNWAFFRKTESRKE